MRVIYDNVIDSAEVVTPSTETANYEGTNVQVTQLTTVWRTTGITSENIVFDAGLGNTFTVDTISLLNHNYTASVILKFQMNATDSWGGPSVDETLTYDQDIILKFIASSSYRYIRITIADTTNTEMYLELGRVFAGEYLQVTPSSLSNFSITNVRTDVTQNSIANQAYSDIGVGYRLFRYDFPPSGYTMIQSWRTVWDTVGRHTPFVFLNFDLDYTMIKPAYVIFQENFEEQFTRVKRVSYSLILRETN